MATTAEKLKKEFTDAPVEYYESLTFEELSEGQKFIIFPTPGDNYGHGGFRKAHWVFEKIKNRKEELAPGIPYDKSLPHGVGVNTKTKIESDFTLSMPVLLVE